MSAEIGFDRRRLGAKLKKSREYLGYSQDEVALIVGVSRSAISLIESGLRGIDVSELKKMADLYKQSTSYFTQEAISYKENEAIRALARKAQSLSSEDINELEQFAEYLTSRAEARKGK